MESLLSLLDTPPPAFLTALASPSAFAAIGTFAICANIALWCPASWKPIDRSYLIAITHSIVSFCLCVPLLAKHWDDITDISTAPSIASLNSLWTSLEDEYAVPVAVAAGYLSFDLTLGTILDPGMIDSVMITHHCIGIAAAVMGIVLQCGGLPMMALYLVNEGSNPFTNLHFLSGWSDPANKHNPAARRYRTLNGVCMWISYLLFRIIPGLYFARLFVLMYTHTETGTAYWNGEQVTVITDRVALPSMYPGRYVYYLQFILGSLLQVMNAVWFYKISRGLWKALKSFFAADADSQCSGGNDAIAAASDASSETASSASSTPLAAKKSSFSVEDVSSSSPLPDVVSAPSAGTRRRGGAATSSSKGDARPRSASRSSSGSSGKRVAAGQGKSAKKA